MSRRPLDAQELRPPLILPTIKIPESIKKPTLIRLRSWTKMLKNMDVTMSTLESTGNYKYFPFPQKTMVRSGWIISDSDLTTLTRVG